MVGDAGRPSVATVVLPAEGGRGPPAGRPEVMVHRGCSASMPGTRIAHLPPRRGDHPLPAWLADARLDSAARLIRGFHDATAGTFLAGDQEVVCHGDLGPQHRL
jgi:hypothetical protein